MISYIDLLSLLLAFFVLLYTLSNVDKSKFKSMSEALGNAVAEQNKKDQSEQFKQEDLAKVQSELAAYFESNKLADRVNMNMTPEGLRIAMSASFFEVGEDALLPDGVEVLHAIALKVKDKTYKLRIEGHTDNVPIHTDKFPNNWFLSAARACSVIQYLLKTGMEPGRMSAVGLADQVPLVANDSPEHRGQNRRIELIVVRFKE